MYWPHMHTVQRSDTSKGIPTKIARWRSCYAPYCATCDFVGEGRGSSAPLLGQNATRFLFITKAVGLHMTYTILPPL
eukprot:10789145-Ditylum_brightwellii.AAC.1